jgi:uncharacterized membrane protein YheB (UPF0754 family)
MRFGTLCRPFLLKGESWLMKILLPVLISAAIGLFTNWLAIVMLFRPWKEKRLFGIRMPMTPGLIPRRQNELAEKLGQIVDEELLTAEGLARSISRPELEDAVKRAAVRSLRDTLNEAPTLGALAERVFGPDALNRAQGWAVRRAGECLRSDEGSALLIQLADTLFDLLSTSLQERSARKELARGFATPLYQHLANGTILWRDALPEGARALVEERLLAQIGPLLERTSLWLRDPDVVAAISKMLQEKVENIPLIGPMAKGFLTPERVLHDVVPRLQQVVESHTIRELAEEKAREFLRGIWERPVGRVLGRLSEDDLTELLDKMLPTILDRAFADQTASRNMFRDLIVRSLTSGASEVMLADLIGRLRRALENWNLRELYLSHSEDVESWISKAWRWLRGHLIDNLPTVLDALDIRTIVRDQIASYPIPTLEKLVLSVASKELRMITWLGGVLGGIIGLVQALLLL